MMGQKKGKRKRKFEQKGNIIIFLAILVGRGRETTRPHTHAKVCCLKKEGGK